MQDWVISSSFLSFILIKKTLIYRGLFLCVAKPNLFFFNFNGGLFVKKAAEHYSFSANQAGDAGGGIFCSNQDIAAYSTLKFEVDGSVTQHGNWTRLVIQIYDDGDSNSAPAISLDPIIVSADQQTIEVPLYDQVDKLAKIQFILVADSGSCNVDIHNLRFE